MKTCVAFSEAGTTVLASSLGSTQLDTAEKAEGSSKHWRRENNRCRGSRDGGVGRTLRKALGNEHFKAREQANDEKDCKPRGEQEGKEIALPTVEGE